MQLAWPRTLHPCLVIQHGIWWDSNEMATWEVRLQSWMIKKIVDRCDEMICVDTNFINWFRATWPHTDISTKVSYIPNYVDPAIFHPAQPRTGRDEVVVVYPRRLCLRRGLMETVHSIKPVLAACPNVKFHFIGDGELEIPLRDYIRDHNLQDVAQVYALPPDQMQQAYERADVVVIPTLAGEGTSLSCVEAMYCGRPVIVTTVGGLPNLVLDEYNGLLIGPNEQELTAAIIRLARDPELRTRLASNAKKIADLLTIDVWKERVGVRLRRLLDRVRA
jgi:glycosyltransferase involved in cell wall biosynthesis